jgi:sugar phosphate isomerase/epimerase
MKISISNIAWDPCEEAEVARLMAERGIRGVELAPTKIWPSLEGATGEAARDYRDGWEAQGVKVVAFQSLLFGRPELGLFQSEEVREETFAYLSRVIRLGSEMGARALVFGSPRNRLVGELAPARAMDVAVEFFFRLGEVAQRHQTLFCIEPNPTAYGCDFIRTAAEGRELVARVNHPGFRLHLDAGVMALNGEPYERAIEEGFEYLAHFHISEPQLAVVGNGQTDHARVARHLRQLGYDRWVSLEMRPGWAAPNTISVQRALDFVAEVYG